VEILHHLHRSTHYCHRTLSWPEALSPLPSHHIIPTPATNTGVPQFGQIEGSWYVPTFSYFFLFHFVDCNGSLIMEVRSGLLVLVFSRMKMKVVVYGGFEDGGLLLYWWFGMDEKRKIKVRLDSLIMNKGAWFGGRNMGDKNSFSVSSSLVFFPLMWSWNKVSYVGCKPCESLLSWVMSNK